MTPHCADLPDDSPLIDFVRVQSEYFGRIERLNVLMDGADFDNPSTVEALCTLDNNIGNLSFALKESSPRWTTGYLQYVGMCWHSRGTIPPSLDPALIDPNWMYA